MLDISENVEDVLPDWSNDDIEETLAQAVTLYEKQEEQETRFFVEENLENILEQSHVRRDWTKHKMDREIVSR